MGCKKIWDSRRKSEASNPVSPIDPRDVDNIPDYSRQYDQYIR